jgi:hypothetical protein
VSTPRQAVTVRSRRHRAAVSLIVLLAVTLGSAGNLMVQPAGALEPPTHRGLALRSLRHG